MNEQEIRELRERMEVRIVALLLGEASAFETAEIEQAMRREPELAAFHAEMRRTIDLTREASKQLQTPSQPAAEQPKLSPERREALLARFKQPKVATAPVPRPARRLRRWLVPASLAAAFVILLYSVSTPSLRRARSSSPNVTDARSSEGVETYSPLGGLQRLFEKSISRATKANGEPGKGEVSTTVTVVPDPDSPLGGQTPKATVGFVDAMVSAAPAKPQIAPQAVPAPKVYLPHSQSSPHPEFGSKQPEPGVSGEPGSSKVVLTGTPSMFGTPRTVLDLNRNGASEQFGEAQLLSVQPSVPLSQAGGEGVWARAGGRSSERLQEVPVGAISPSGQQQTVRLWDSQTGKSLTEPLELGPGPLSAQFAADGKRKATIPNNHPSRVWDMKVNQFTDGAWEGDDGGVNAGERNKGLARPGIARGSGGIGGGGGGFGGGLSLAGNGADPATRLPSSMNRDSAIGDATSSTTLGGGVRRNGSRRSDDFAAAQSNQGFGTYEINLAARTSDEFAAAQSPSPTLTWGLGSKPEDNSGKIPQLGDAPVSGNRFIGRYAYLDGDATKTFSEGNKLAQLDRANQNAAIYSDPEWKGVLEPPTPALGVNQPQNSQAARSYTLAPIMPPSSSAAGLGRPSFDERLNSIVNRAASGTDDQLAFKPADQIQAKRVEADGKVVVDGRYESALEQSLSKTTTVEARLSNITTNDKENLGFDLLSKASETNTKESHEKQITSKLDQIRLDHFQADGLPLGEVMQSLNDAAKKGDPDHRGVNFLADLENNSANATASINPATGLPVGPGAGLSYLNTTTIKLKAPLTNITLREALEAVQQVADHPIQYSVKDSGVLFSWKTPDYKNKEEAKTPKAAPSIPPTPKPEINTGENAFSTFSLNVSDVSFKLAAASLENNTMPDPASIRVEEFVNAFNYHDPAPQGSARMAFAWERARYPFAHNRDILRFAIQTAARGREPQKPLNLVVLLDNSGSMERPDRVQIVHEALKVLAQRLQPQDRISVVAFARTARLWVDGMAGGKPKEFLDKVLELNPDGGTNLEDALGVGYATAARHFMADGINRVILLTDGAANLGNVEPEVLKQRVVTNRIKGIALDCFGIGWEGYNDDLLEILSHNGDGRYGFLDHPEEAAPEFANQLAGALNVAAADVKTQVEFNPGRILNWRQIGYAKHQLTKEQFRDNTVDAAELAAAESGNALYAVQVNPEGSGPLGVVRVRYKIPASGQYVEQAWTIPYQPKVAALDEASPAMRLAVTASAFGEWLSQSPYAGEVTPAALQPYLNGVSETYAPDPRPQRLAAMIQTAQALNGK